jgi:hypothetical protein
MRWGRARRQADTIDLRGAAIDRSSLEVIELRPDEPPRRPTLDPLAGLPAPRETPYARPGRDPGSLRGFWEAMSGLES